MMYPMKAYPIAVLMLGLTLWGNPVAAQQDAGRDYFPLIEEYVNKIENIYNDQWAYTYTSHDHMEDETRTVRVNRSLPPMESERLLAVNGMPPTEEELQDHREDLEREIRERRRDEERALLEEDDEEIEMDEKERFLAMINRDSIRRVREEDNLLYLEFTAMEEQRRRIFEHLIGTLVIDTEREYIRELRVRPTESFSPFFLSHVEDGYFSLRFDLHDGVPMQAAVTWRLDGHAFFIRNLDADMDIVWMDFERIESTR